MVVHRKLQDPWRLTFGKDFNKKEFEARIREIPSGHHTRLELDLNLLESITSSGLGQIAMTCLDLKAQGIQVDIVGISPKVQGMLDRHGLSDLLAATKL